MGFNSGFKWLNLNEMKETYQSFSREFASESLLRCDKTDHVMMMMMMIIIIIIIIIIYKPVFKIAIIFSSIFLLSSYTSRQPSMINVY